MMPVRCSTSRSRTRCSACRSSYSAVLVATRLHRRALHGFGNRLGIIEVVLLSLAIGADIFGRHQPGIVTEAMQVCGSGDVRRRRLPCRSSNAVYWRAALPLGHATTFAAARWRPAHRGPRRGTSSCPISMPITAIAVLRWPCRHGVLLVVGAPCWLRLLAGQEHGRTIPLTDLRLAESKRE